MNLDDNTKIYDFDTEVARGNVRNAATWNKWGYNNDIDTGTEEIIASWGGAWSPPTTAETIDFVSTDANDTSGGTGLNSIVIYGIDEDRTSIIEVLTLDGLTPVTTTNTYFGINRVAPFLCGSSKSNEGKITGDQTTSGIIVAEMPIGETVTQQAIFYVDAGNTFLTSSLYINVLKISGGGTPVVTIKGYVYSPVANANIQIFRTKIDTGVENSVYIEAPELFPITESSVLYFTATTDTNNTSVDLRFNGKLVQNIPV
jgi:hypothetical protein